MNAHTLRRLINNPPPAGSEVGALIDVLFVPPDEEEVEIGVPSSGPRGFVVGYENEGGQKTPGFSPVDTIG